MQVIHPKSVKKVPGAPKKAGLSIPKSGSECGLRKATMRLLDLSHGDQVIIAFNADDDRYYIRKADDDEQGFHVKVYKASNNSGVQKVNLGMLTHQLADHYRVDRSYQGDILTILDDPKPADGHIWYKLIKE